MHSPPRPVPRRADAMYVCMYVMFIRCDKRTSNNKHKKQSQDDVQYKAAKPKKLFHSTKLYKERIRQDFLWRSVEYSGSWYECSRVLKLARFLVGGSKWFRACVGAHNLQKKIMITLIHKFCYSGDSQNAAYVVKKH